MFCMGGENDHHHLGLLLLKCGESIFYYLGIRPIRSEI
ncbi:hypothetical protein CIPAW_05G238700 [Carya illinoinensis]|uniref:Uncharacterized protein n=1 Tax=Carya illinoinensis TaxID=32201 RepID=A0A8T1QNB7_CARIL|nr:hypothetical protein CIPAW_05G238700 [Carya illinoinensis]